MRQILILTPEVPYPPEQGASLRNFYIIKGLARHSDVSLLSASSATGDRVSETESYLKHLCRKVRIIDVAGRSSGGRLTRMITSRMPDIADRFRSKAFERALIELLHNNQDEDGMHKPYDVVQIEGLELAQFIPIVRANSPSSRILYDAHNAETELQRRAYSTDIADVRRWPAAAYSYLQTRRLARFESRACQSADRVTAVSGSDATILSNFVPKRKPAVIPNCIDIEEYGPSEEASAGIFDLIFTGKMDYRPNVDAVLWFASEIWPEILRARHDATWAIVGKNPHSRLNSLRTSPGITITGYVERVQPYLSGAKIVILPLRMGSGTRLKLLEALASSKAVVSTTIGAEGFPNIDAKTLKIADEPDQFAKTVLSLLNDENTRSELGLAGREFAEGYDWRQIIPLFEDVYDSMLQ